MREGEDKGGAEVRGGGGGGGARARVGARLVGVELCRSCLRALVAVPHVHRRVASISL
jgi:hypothetical protein